MCHLCRPAPCAPVSCTCLKRPRYECDENESESIHSQDSERSDEDGEEDEEDKEFIEDIRTPHDYVRDWSAKHASVMMDAKKRRPAESETDWSTRKSQVLKIETSLKFLIEHFEGLKPMMNKHYLDLDWEDDCNYFDLFDSIGFEVELARRRAKVVESS